MLDPSIQKALPETQDPEEPLGGTRLVCPSECDVDVCTHPELRRQVIRVRLVHLLPAREHVLQLVVIHLVHPLFERVGGFVLVRLERGEVLGDFVVASRAERSGVSTRRPHSTPTTLPFSVSLSRSFYMGHRRVGLGVWAKVSKGGTKDRW